MSSLILELKTNKDTYVDLLGYTLGFNCNTNILKEKALESASNNMFYNLKRVKQLPFNHIGKEIFERR